MSGTVLEHPLGAQAVITDLWLRVRVGVLTRTEDVSLRQGWAIEAAKTSSPAGACG